MALNKQDGQVNSSDVQFQRIQAGTVTRHHVQQGGLSSSKFTSIIDDSHRDIKYGLYPGYAGPTTITILTSEASSSGGTQTVIGGIQQTTTAGGYAKYTFTGSSIGVLGATNPYSGAMKIYIDDVLTAGRTVTTCTIRVPPGINVPAIAAGDTTISALGGGYASFPTSGKLLIGDEIIPYTGKGAFNTFTGCTVTKDHSLDETIYLMSSFIDLGTTGAYGVKRLLYFNPFLENREHTITIVADVSPLTGYTSVYFDGFVLGSLLGSKNIFTQLNSFRTTFTTDANGHCDIGQIVPNTNDAIPLSMAGWTQEDCESTSSGTVTNNNKAGLLLMKYQPDGQPFYYFHNGPVSTSVTLNITFACIGESI